ncbi:hypothetical protein PNOK_0884200 [Pyrrhoderma noxium]|uniref:DUF6533 domain-containing protein n=1 Tax=Pyrrhoderma noxium TaxID=2282107 RepID=A0A286U8Z8_9AGAM|nr:hypothetical protein PNOK_0884200 [Pyrrhoderma noxium]
MMDNSTSFVAELELLRTVAYDLRVTNALTLSSLVILIYDIVLTFSDEVKYVWAANWTLVKLLFFLNRYPVIFVSFLVLFSDLDTGLGLDLSRMDGWSMLAVIIPVQLIFCLRTTALWDRRRSVLIILLATLLICDSAIGVFIWLFLGQEHFAPNNIPELQNVLGCYATLSMNVSTMMLVPAVSALMCFDAIILLFTIVRFIIIRRSGEGKGSVMKMLFRDGVIYYIVAFASSLANLLLYAFLPKPRRALLGATVPILRTVMSIAANRLVLNLRTTIQRTRNNQSSISTLTTSGISSFPPSIPHIRTQTQDRIRPPYLRSSSTFSVSTIADQSTHNNPIEEVFISFAPGEDWSKSRTSVVTPNSSNPFLSMPPSSEILGRLDTYPEEYSLNDLPTSRNKEEHDPNNSDDDRLSFELLDYETGIAL